MPTITKKRPKKAAELVPASGVKAKRREIIKEVLYSLAEENEGRLSPKLVLDAARDPSHQLHSEFEWDDSDAAEGFRLIQAAGLIRSVRIRIIRETEDPKRVSLTIHRGIVSLPSLRGSEEGSYVPLENVKDTSELLKEALVQMEAFKKRYLHLQELSGVWKALDEIA